MKTVYLLHHTARVGRDEDVKLVGVFRSKEDAERVIAQLKDKSGFRDAGGEWSCHEHEIGKFHWQEGYVGDSK